MVSPKGQQRLKGKKEVTPKSLLNEQMAKIPFGRPSTFKIEYCEMLVAHMAKGFSFESFAGVVKTTYDTLYEWKKNFPLFSQAHKMGISERRIHDEKLFNDCANGDVKGNAALLLFKMKTSHKLNDDLTGMEKLKLMQLGLMSAEQIQEKAKELLAEYIKEEK